MITGFRRPDAWSVRGGAFVLFAALSCLAAAACQRVPLLAPSGSTIALSTLASTLPLNGTTHIIAQVIEPAGTPPQRGTLVTFTTTLGTIDPIEAETDTAGRVMVTFSAGTQSGTATIAALSGGVNTGDEGLVRIAVGAAAVSSIALTALPGTISSGGTSAVTAIVNDAGGNAIAGVPVTFSTDNGSVSPAVATTNASGVATTTLATTRTAKVTARAGVAASNGTNTTAAPSAEVTVTVEPLPTVSIASSGNAQVGLPTTFTITVQPGAGSSATIQNVNVNFGEGGDLSLGALTGTTTVQHVYTSSGSKTARVTATDSSGGHASAATIVFVQTQAPIVSLTATSSTAGGTTSVNFTATVTPPGTSVAQYVWNFGDGQSQTTFVNTVSHNYATASLPRTATVTITTTTNQTASSSTTVTP